MPRLCCPLAQQPAQNVPVDASLSCDEAAIFRGTIKGTLSRSLQNALGCVEGDYVYFQHGSGKGNAFPSVIRIRD